MGSLFSTISGQFTKPIIIGAMFPTAIFLTMFYLFVLPMMPWELHSVTRFAALETQWKLLVISMVSVVLSFVLYVLNNQIIRFYEGYPWEHGPIGTFLANRRRAEVERAIGMRDEINPLRRDYIAAVGRDAKAMTLEDHERELIRIVWKRNPKPSSVLPTRLGNMIRSFENYAERQYGFSAIAFWPRFAVKIDQNHALALDDVKSSFDFVLNLSLLSGILFIVTLGLGLAFPLPRQSAMQFALWIGKLAVMACAAWLFYIAAIDRAAEWGDLVRAAFDLHRRTVLQSLGFTEIPQDLNEERALWGEISRQIAWGDPFQKKPRVRFADRATRLTPDTPDLIVTRGILPTATAGRHQIIVEVRNTGNTAVNELKVVDTIDATKQLVWGTAQVNGANASFSGTNPYTFELGAIAARSSLVLRYEVQG